MSVRELNEDERLRELARAFAVKAEVEELVGAALEAAASFVSVGRLSLEDILDKKGPLTAEEADRLKELPSVWAEFAAQVDELHAQGVPEIIGGYCERWDGSGYPKGLSGNDIPIGARILAVCYHYNGMISDRPYRKALAADSAAYELRRMSGSVLDPSLVEAFLEMIEDIPEPIDDDDVVEEAVAVEQDDVIEEAEPVEDEAPPVKPKRPSKRSKKTPSKRKRPRKKKS
jgi:response regulator RpfG family c-di-GMP phosphodiesterase